jgi:hypothetical protein
VKRLVAALAFALLAGTGSLPLLHVHLYGEHDHPDHHHGPALHSHGHRALEQAAPGRGPARPQVGPCGPDAHVLALQATLAPSPDYPLSLLVPAKAAPALAAAPLRPLVARREVRAHSPPGLTDSPLRAPPSHLPA